MLPAPSVLTRVADRFDPISLFELGEAALMDRVGAKFMLPVGQVPALLELLIPRYRMLEVGGVRNSHYATQYFDTEDLRLYRDHLTGRLPRFKVRVRSYLDSDTHYLEFKVRTNKERTLKERVRLRGGVVPGVGTLFDALPAALASRLRPRGLGPSVRTEFHRMTLVGIDTTERVTVDLDLRLSVGDAKHALPTLVVLEVKQERAERSPAREALKALGIREGGLSKYCLGVSALVPGVRKNRFKPVLHRLERVALASLPFPSL